MISHEKALQIVLEKVGKSAIAAVEPQNAFGFACAEKIYSPMEYPPWNKSIRDGYGILISDAGKDVKVSGLTAPGGPQKYTIEKGVASGILTGGICSSDMEAVVKIEDVVNNTDGTITLPVDIVPGMNIEKKGSVLRTGDIILDEGDELTPAAIGALAFTGISKIKVWSAPRVKIIITGDEIVPPSETPSQFQFRDSNSGIISSVLFRNRVSDISVHYVKDNHDDYKEILTTELPEIVILSGAVSMGKYDFVPEILNSIGVEKHFHRVSQKPGRPLFFGTRNETLFFGLPGNPMASKFCMDYYVAPAIRKLMGLKYHSLKIAARLEKTIETHSPRTQFISGITSFYNGEISFLTLEEKGSSDIFSGAKANSYAIKEQGDTTLKDQMVTVLPSDIFI
ncbi:MAG: molybdopterin molybdotransferase MoeA [Deltaproteobacteria bacterium]|nr:molybdopterin molybdotransferase MoeA [Deltaproteobacteria bacterium]